MVFSFSSYPSLNGVPPSVLVGAEFSLRPSILKVTEYDILEDFTRYGGSEQRRGK